VTYKPLDKLLLSADLQYYLEKETDWEGDEELLDANSLELALGLQYNLTDQLAVSGGFLHTRPGTTPEYQNDLRYYTVSNNIGLGGAFKINEMLEVELGGAIIMYQDDDKNMTNETTAISFTETYGKSSWIVAVGLNLFLGK
jgi:long-subunit fatty acid transport protein